MSATLSVTILGCGSSAGVPRIGGDWGQCDPENPKNRRLRCSILVEKSGAKGVTRVLIDSSPDLRAQLLAAKKSSLDAVIYTHAHADHVHGIDDLRVVYFNKRARIPVWADPETAEVLRSRFGYVFIKPEGSSYEPILDLNEFDTDCVISGAGGDIRFEAIRVQHGRTQAFGFRFDDVAYIPDVSEIPAQGWGQLQNLRVWILDALRRDPHPSHSHLAQSLDWIQSAAPQRAILTNMHVDLDYEAVLNETPENVEPAFDGMCVSLDL